MHSITGSLFSFLAILNPFALCLYLAGVMEDLNPGNFFRVFAKASLISLLVFWIFAIYGDELLINFLGVRPDALRIFGGIIFFAVGYNYATRGYRATETLRGSLEHLPSEIAVPFMIGAGTITQSILIGKKHNDFWALLILLLGVAVSFAVVILFKLARDLIGKSGEKVFDRYVNILSRINGLIIGAVSTEMVVSGYAHLIRSLYG